MPLDESMNQIWRCQRVSAVALRAPVFLIRARGGVQGGGYSADTANKKPPVNVVLTLGD